MDAHDNTVMDLQADAAMRWLQNFHVIVGEGQKAEDIAGPELARIQAVLDAALARTNRRSPRAADYWHQATAASPSKTRAASALPCVRRSFQGRPFLALGPADPRMEPGAPAAAEPHAFVLLGETRDRIPKSRHQAL